MTSLLRISLLALLLSFGLFNETKAQEKYEYAIVAYHPPTIGGQLRGLHVSISGKEFEQIEVKKDEVKSVLSDFTILVNYLQGMTDNRWRVINSFSASTNQVYGPITFVLERKTTN